MLAVRAVDRAQFRFSFSRVIGRSGTMSMAE